MNFYDARGNEIDGGRIVAQGELFMLTLVTEEGDDEASEHKYLALWIEDDDNWFEVQRFDRLWLADLKQVVDQATTSVLV